MGLSEMPVQLAADHAGTARPDAEATHEIARQGVSGAGGSLPHLDLIQRSFGRHDIGHVKAHVGGTAADASRAMGAHAYAVRDQVAFGSAPDLHTAAHEAAHVVQQRAGVQLKGGVGSVGDAYEQHADKVADAVVAGQSTEPLLDQTPQGSGASDAVQMRAATWLERRAWLAFFDHYLPRKFLNNYMDDTGTALTLTQQEMQDCNPIVNIRRSTAFMSQVARLQAAGGGTEPVNVQGLAGAMTNGTLGNFTIKWRGSVRVEASGSWAFNGTIEFYDFWDFDPKGSGSNRPLPAELKVRAANMFLPGKPFHIYSVQAPASQASSDSSANWAAGFRPVHVGDRAVRTGADIATGDVAGGEVGGEAGAQSSEDLNR
jgi:Domain of unknown function (DUF4157)